jgi:hypothetical protein
MVMMETKTLDLALQHCATMDIQPWIDEGRRIGKVPWCCSMIVEDRVARALQVMYGITERETMQETIERRKSANWET